MTHDWHEQKSIHNYNACEYLRRESPTYIDWEITTIFYSACKLVDAHFIKRGRRKPSSHRQRNEMVKKHLHAVKDEYEELFGLSIIARYEGDVRQSDRDKATEWHRIIVDGLSSDTTPGSARARFPRR